MDDDFALDHSSTISKTKESASSLQLIGTVHCKLYVTIKTAKKENKSHKSQVISLRFASIPGDLDRFQALSFESCTSDTQLLSQMLSQRKWCREIARRSTLGLTSFKSLDFSKFDPETIQLVVVESRRMQRSLFQTHEQIVFPLLPPSMCQILQLRSHAQQ